jgi:hypothetical protein
LRFFWPVACRDDAIGRRLDPPSQEQRRHTLAAPQEAHMLLRNAENFSQSSGAATFFEVAV